MQSHVKLFINLAGSAQEAEVKRQSSALETGTGHQRTKVGVKGLRRWTLGGGARLSNGSYEPIHGLYRSIGAGGAMDELYWGGRWSRSLLVMGLACDWSSWSS